MLRFFISGEVPSSENSNSWIHVPIFFCSRQYSYVIICFFLSSRWSGLVQCSGQNFHFRQWSNHIYVYIKFQCGSSILYRPRGYSKLVSPVRLAYLISLNYRVGSSAKYEPRLSLFPRPSLYNDKEWRKKIDEVAVCVSTFRIGLIKRHCPPRESTWWPARLGVWRGALALICVMPFSYGRGSSLDKKHHHQPPQLVCRFLAITIED